MKLNLKKFCKYLLGIYVVLSVLFCWLAHEHINYYDLQERFLGTEQEDIIEDLREDDIVVQNFTVNEDRINEISLKLTTFGTSFKSGNLFIELADPVSGDVLTSAKCELKNVADNDWKNFYLGVNLEKYRGEELSLYIHTNVKNEDENRVGLICQNIIPENAGKLTLNGTECGLVLDLGIKGANVSGRAVYYYGCFFLGFVLLAIYCSMQVSAERKGKKTLGLKFEQTVEKYWFLLEQLISRDFKTKYKRSVLGVFWSFLNPLLMMIVQYVVFVNLFKFRVENYAVYLLTGIVMFNGMSETTTQAMNSITGNASLITKVYVPKYIYPVSKVLSASINLLLSMLPLLLVSIFTGLRPDWAWLLIPYCLACQIVFMIGLSFVLSSLMVFFRDVQFLWGVLTTAWMYATPIMYPMDILPGFMQQFEKINPMYYYIDFMRTVIIEGSAPAPGRFFACAVFAAVSLIIGSIIFKKTQDQFILYI